MTDRRAICESATRFQKRRCEAIRRNEFHPHEGSLPFIREGSRRTIATFIPGSVIETPVSSEANPPSVRLFRTKYTMMNLFIIRHAWAEERDSALWPDDSKRPLTSEGIARFREVLNAIRPRGFDVSVIGTSPYTRCEQTARLTSEAFKKNPPPIELLEALEPGSDLEAVVEWTNRQISVGHDGVAWVGHAPDTDDLAALLIGDGKGLLRFAKAAVALIRFEERVVPGEGELRWLVTAKILGV